MVDKTILSEDKIYETLKNSDTTLLRDVLAKQIAKVCARLETTSDVQEQEALETRLDRLTLLLTRTNRGQRRARQKGE